MSKQRRIDVDATSLRRIDVASTFFLKFVLGSEKSNPS